MSISQKYNRTYHYDFSPGTTSDDRINFEWRENIKNFSPILHTEKLDGQNNCLSQYGVFARSHAAPSEHPWDKHLYNILNLIKSDLKDNDIEIFGENMYAIHSIEYPNLDSYFYVFGIRCLDMWLSWEEVKWYSDFFELKTAPVLSIQQTNEDIQSKVLELSKGASTYGPEIEGIVSRNPGEYHVDDFSKNVFKWVRKNHVKTDSHWTRNWKVAKINY